MIVFSVLFIILAIVFLTGKGDKLIAGYNTASEEERQQVNIHRLRILMAIVSVITAVVCYLIPYVGTDKRDVLSATGIFCLVLFVFIILANTWAKKK